MVRGIHILLASAALALVPSASAAQNATTADNTTMNTAIDPAFNGVSEPMAADPMMDNMVTPVEEDDDDFPWGLLGLVGLAGLLGRKKRDDDYTRVEPRNVNDTTTATRNDRL